MRLTVEDLGCRVGGFQLEGVSLELPPGGRLALVGPNGSGKSTLLRAISGRLPARGRVLVDGMPLAAMAPRQRARAICLLPQTEGGGGAFTVEDYVLLGRYPHLGWLGLLGARDRRRAGEAMERMGCLPWRTRRLDSLSGGERQLVRLAAALAQEARILLLDEPGTFLDPGQRRRLWARLDAALAEDGISLIYVSHDLNEALWRADRFLALEQGRPLRQGPAAHLAEGDWLGRLFGLPLAAARRPGSGRTWLLEEEGDQEAPQP
ncbi:MAG: ABC transporter ATP-binding protein [bacterium]|nr:ABC transporter ATP-binding protein [bacterium]